MEFDKKKAMDELGIDEETFNELFKSFFSDAEAEVKKIENAVAMGDFDEIARGGHTLKGLAGNYRIAYIQDHAKIIELLAKNDKDTQKIVQNLQILKGGLEELRKDFGR